MAASGIARASALLASGTLVSRVLGFARSWLLIQVIGATGFATDAFATADSAPNVIYAIISQGLLNAVLIPQLVRAAKHADGGQSYINRLVTLGIVVFGGITLLATLCSPGLMHLFGLHGAQGALATAFAYWSLPQIFFYGLYSLLGEVLNARKSFGPFTWAPVLNNVVGIGTLVLFLGLYGRNPEELAHVGDWSPGRIALLAGGYTAGIAAQALVLFAFWRSVGLRFRFEFGIHGMEFRTVGKAAMWTFAMLLCTQLAGVVETNVANSASRGGNASTQVLNTAWLIFMLPYSIIAVSVVTAYFTRMAEHARDEDHEAFRADYSAAVRGITLLISISAALLIVAAFPFSRIFTPDYTAFGWVLVLYLLGLVPFTIGFVTLRAFYSLGDTRSPFLYTLVQSAIVVVGSLLCLAVPASNRAAGIALVVSIAGTVQTVLAMVYLARALNGIDLRGIVRAVVKGFLASAVAWLVGGAVLYILGGTHDGWAVENPGTAIATCVVLAAVMVPVYLGGLWTLRTDELTDAWSAVRARLGRSR